MYQRIQTKINKEIEQTALNCYKNEIKNCRFGFV